MHHTTTTGTADAHTDAPAARSARHLLSQAINSPYAGSELTELLKAPWCPDYVITGLATELLGIRSSSPTAPQPAERQSLERILAVLASHPAINAETMARLATCSSPVKRALAGRVNAAPELLDVLARDRDWETRLHVAGNPVTSEATLRQLANDPDPSVRITVISNPNCPSELLEQIYTCPSDLQLVRAAAANPKLPANVAHQWADHHEPNVRAAIAGNQRLPELTMHRLANDPDIRVQRYLAKNPHLSPALAQYLAHPAQPLNTRIALSDNRSLAAAVATDMLVDPSEIVRRRIALNQQALNSSALAQAALDEDDPRVLAALVRHPKLPGSIAHTLITRVGESSRRSKAFVRAAAHHLEEISPATAYAIANLHDIASTAALVARPDCPLNIFAASAAHPLPDLRRAAAANPSCPPGTLENLVYDPDPLAALIAVYHIEANN